MVQICARMLLYVRADFSVDLKLGIKIMAPEELDREPHVDGTSDCVFGLVIAVVVSRESILVVS